MESKLRATLESFAKSSGNLCVLTGAGISKESGIPTFRGEEGYWVVGSRNYVPEEMATQRMFQREPEEVWSWYLMRFTVCLTAKPNPGHLALVELERHLGDRFSLVTQNIDGLHARAGQSPERTFCIHGNADRVRCAKDCGLGIVPLPELPPCEQPHGLSEARRRLLTCPRCGAWLRPHVLWFDECYEEELYRSDTAFRHALEADMLLVVGTSGATNLPMRIGEVCARRKVPMINVDPEPNPFSKLVEATGCGHWVKRASAAALPEIKDALIAA